MENERSYLRDNDDWIAEHGDELVVCGPLIATVAELAGRMSVADKNVLVEELRARQRADEGVPVSPGIGMGWPELKDL